MSRIYVDRISPYQSGSITIDGYQAEINTGSFATTGSNSFIGNQVITGSVTTTGLVTKTVDYSQAGLQRLTNINNVTSTDGASYSTGFDGYFVNGNKENQGYLRLYSQPGQYFSDVVHSPEMFRINLQPSGSSSPSTIKLQRDAVGPSTTATIKADNIQITGSVITETRDYPGNFGTNVIELYSPLTLTNGAVYGDICRQQSNIQSILNGKINGFFTSFRETRFGPSSYYAQEYIGPRFIGWEMRPSGSAAESTIQLFNADNNGTNVVAKITADDVDINGPVTLDQTLKLEAQDPLPSGTLGQLAVSGSDLYFHNGTNWIQK